MRGEEECVEGMRWRIKGGCEGRYLQGDDVVLPVPENFTASGFFVGDLDLETSVCFCHGGFLAHCEHSIGIPAISLQQKKRKSGRKSSKVKKKGKRGMYLLLQTNFVSPFRP